MIDSRMQIYLTQLNENIASASILELEKELINKVNIRNPSAYLVGVCRRIADESSRIVIQRAIDNNEPPMGKELTGTVMKRIEKLELEGYCGTHDIDERCRDMLAEITESEAICALEELQATERNKVKNVGKYFIGMIVFMFICVCEYIDSVSDGYWYTT